MTVQAPKGVGEAAAALEAYFLRQVFASVLPDSSTIAGSGFAGSTFREMFEGALADAMSQGGGIGMAAQLSEQLAPLAEAAPTPSGGGALTVKPVEGGVAWGFGDRIIHGHAGHHFGVDLGAPMGTPVHAAGGGRVIRTGDGHGYGNLVVIDHGDGLETRYAHLSKIEVKVGDQVAPGEVVGASGETGNAANPHLHFEVWRDGKPVDPSGELALPKPRRHP